MRDLQRSLADAPGTNGGRSFNPYPLNSVSKSIAISKFFLSSAVTFNPLVWDFDIKYVSAVTNINTGKSDEHVSAICSGEYFAFKAVQRNTTPAYGRKFA
jgi:hypothetical protein